MYSTALSCGVLRSTQSPQRTGVNSGVRGISIISPRVQTSAAHARRYEGAAGTAVPESGIVYRDDVNRPVAYAGLNSNVKCA
jgi:hypothetical protein